MSAAVDLLRCPPAPVRQQRLAGGRRLQAVSPQPYEAKPIQVSALLYGGAGLGAGPVVEWVRRAGTDADARVEADGAVVVDQPAPGLDPVRLEPGMFLVLHRGAVQRWAAYTGEQFRACFQPLPRELPIFDDGEVA